ncbi:MULTISPECIES: hypothetical protein [Actibacterium]|uniref:1,4-alpha-glucan branching enzyme n=1 Tax=Actibacterium naphthalenivorans TaxID=1614693 RepID=A0A840C811_9RHOB|nr:MULTISPECIES: hypothetical protein [Actibacterium]ALG89206.1 1,4-alpha-glucan branching enzyme [Actibacterium sp. EMB200-NS6]MBB4021210.1 hypothetical protein [Actibacterium naphthalenivorans]
MSEAEITTDHDVIRKWTESRGGHPTRVAGTGDGGVLRIDFHPPDDGLKTIEWGEFFTVFEDRKLAFLHLNKTEGGQPSRFNKFVDRDTGA